MAQTAQDPPAEQWPSHRRARSGNVAARRTASAVILTGLVGGLGAIGYGAFSDDHDSASGPLPAPSASRAEAIMPDVSASLTSLTSLAPRPPRTPPRSASVPASVPMSYGAPPRVTHAPARTPRPPATRATTTTPRTTSATRPSSSPAKQWQTLAIAGTRVLEPGQSWATDRLRLTLQPSGDLTLADQGRTVWRTGTSTGVKLVMQNDGNLVLYDNANAGVWSSLTMNHPDAELVLGGDGVLRIRWNSQQLWRAGTATSGAR